MGQKISWRGGSAVFFLVLIALLAVSRTPQARESANPYKVYVILGFHVNFYHSWRGDTNDEAGFGTDIRVVRAIIKMLDEANAQGLDARGYWEGDNHFTFENIIPQYAPDIIAGIRARVKSGQDEIALQPYTNSLFSAMTEDEMRAAVKWTMHNPWGSGMGDLFGPYVPLIRPQEGMATTGLIPILREEGVTGIILAYSAYPFTTISNFVPVLPPEQRYNPIWLRTREGEDPIVLFPCVSVGDVVNHNSLRKWMLELRALQESGKVKSDMVIHINFDADAETWLPMLPRGLGWVPNGGGLPEYIRYVNQFEWAQFTTPGQYLMMHKPAGEVLVRQDMADGAWDGNYAWAEKYPSHQIWTELEKSRLYSRQAKALAKTAPADVAETVRRLLEEGRDSSFFQRLRCLSTTHFGMSTPLVNEERQAVGEKIAAAAKAKAREALRLLADRLEDKPATRPEIIYAFEARDPRTGARDEAAGPVFSLVRVPILLDDPQGAMALEDAAGNPAAYSLVNLEPLSDKWTAAELMLPLSLNPGEARRFYLKAIRAVTAPPEGFQESPLRLEQLNNSMLTLQFDRSQGISSLRLGGQEFGGPDFLAPFITYVSDKKPATYFTKGYEIGDLAGELWQGLTRSRLATTIPFATPHGEAVAKLEFTFTLPDSAPWVVADVAVSYPYTVKEDVLHTIQQKLRRYLDLRWIEVAPFQMHPRLMADRSQPIRVWKHNYLGVTSYYDMNYAQINPRNADWDSLNHQVTAGWVAVTDRRQGLLVAESAEALTSYAFMPMRLREREGRQQLWLNPFGSYYGRQPDYSHLGGNGLGADMAVMAGANFHPNGPSYNGMTERFSLLIAPYAGDEPPATLTAQAAAFFYPPLVVYLRTPAGAPARLKEDVRELIAAAKRETARQAAGPLPAPLAFLVNPTEGAVDVVWDEPADARIDGYQINWRQAEESEWKTVDIGRGRRHRLEPMPNGKKYAFRMRAAGLGQTSAWTNTLECEVGPVKVVGIASQARGLTPKMIGKFLLTIIIHVLNFR